MLDVKEILDARVICGEDLLDMDVKAGCGSDLMSHVLAAGNGVRRRHEVAEHQKLFRCHAPGIRPGDRHASGI